MIILSTMTLENIMIAVLSLICLVVVQSPYLVSAYVGAYQPIASVWLCVNGSPHDPYGRCVDGSQPRPIGTKGNIPSESSSNPTGQTQLLCANGSKPDANGKCADGSKPIPIPYPIGGIGSHATSRLTQLLCADGSKPQASGRCIDGSQPFRGSTPADTTGQTQLLCANGSKPDANGKCADGLQPRVQSPQSLEELGRQMMGQKYSKSEQLISDAEKKKNNTKDDIIGNLK